MRPVARLGRACFFDRAGYDFSDPSPRPLTLANEADDLHRTLQAAQHLGAATALRHAQEQLGTNGEKPEAGDCHCIERGALEGRQGPSQEQLVP